MDFSKYTPESLLEYLKNTGENRHWEFKSRGVLTKNFKQDIASEVSAFANSGGGRIVLGIKETSRDERIEGQSKKRKVYSYEIDRWPESQNNQKMVDYLNGIVSTCVVPHLHEFQVHPIAPSIPGEEPVFVVDIGDSIHAPHQTNVNDQFRYYYRTGDKSKEAPHHFLEAKRNRVTKALLDVEDVRLDLPYFKFLNRRNHFRMTIRCVLSVRNISLQCAAPWGVHVESQGSRWNLVDKKKGNIRGAYSIQGNRALLPDETETLEVDLYTNAELLGNTVQNMFFDSGAYKAWEQLDLRLRPVSQNCIGEEVRVPSQDREIQSQQVEVFRTLVIDRLREFSR